MRTPEAAPDPWDDRAVLLEEEDERRWRQGLQGHTVLTVEADDWRPAAAWLQTHLATSTACTACAAWAGARLGLTAEELLALSPELRPEFSARLDRHATGAPRWPDGEHSRSERDAAALCREALGWSGSGVVPLLARLGAWTVIAPHETLPALLLKAGGDLPALLAAGDRLALDGYPVGLRVARGEWQELLAGGGWDRTITRWRMAPFADGERFREPGNADPLPGEGTRRFVAAAAPGAVPLLARASALIAREKSARRDEVSGEARSAVEALLFAVLEARSLTARRFALNAPLPFVFGLRPAEADLAAADARMVVEIDGYYHFRDADGYRRDRRKDALLQEHGWFVQRFLVEDVVGNLEAVVTEIERILARRDACAPPSVPHLP